MDAPTLFDALPDDDPPLVRAFELFHAANPHVFALFERFALEVARARPGARIGARAIWERMRWHVRFETTEQRAGGWRLNDHHAPYCARLFLRRHPELAGLFELRRAQGEPARASA